MHFHVDCNRKLGSSILSLSAISEAPRSGFHPIQYISVSCKLAQWQVADPVAFYTRRMTIIFGISGYVKLVTLYCHTIFWETEGFGEGCVKIMQIVSCLELMTNLFIFIHNRKM